MTCPACQAPLESPEMVGVLTICPACLASVVMDSLGIRRAMASDTVPLPEHQREALIVIRKRLRKAR